MKKLIFLLIGSIFLFSLVSASQVINDDEKVEYRIESITGNESLLYNVSIQGYQVCMQPKQSTKSWIAEVPIIGDVIESDLVQGALEVLGFDTVEVTVPDQLKLTKLTSDLKVDSKKEVQYIPQDKDTGAFCYTLNPLVDRYVKFGEQSIIIASDTSYGANLYTNVTQEDGFVHLNLTNESNTLYLPFDVDYSTTSVSDYSGYNNNFLFQNLPTWNSSGVIGGSYNFNGINQTMNISNVLGISGKGNMTVSLWVYINTDNESGNFFNIGRFSGSDGFGIGVGTNQFNNKSTTDGNELILSHNGVRWIDTNSNFTIGWNHVAVSYRNTGVPEIYLNGNNVLNSTGANMGAPFGVAYIGGYTVSGLNRYFNGSIDEVVYYNKYQNATQILDLYNNVTSRVITNGTMSFFGLVVGQNGSQNRMNVSTWSQQYVDSSLFVRLKEWNGTNYNDSVDGTVDPSLVLYMHFDNRSAQGENDSNVFDYSGHQNNGTPKNGAFFNGSGGEYNGAYMFDGINDYLEVNNNTMFDPTFDNMTIAFWIKTGVTATTWRAVQKRGSGAAGTTQGWQISRLAGAGGADWSNTVFDDGVNYVQISSDGQLDSGINNLWHFYVFVWDGDGNNVTAYLDGIDARVNTLVSGAVGNISTGRKLTIGSSWNDPATQAQFLNGSIDEVQIYNRSLTLQEIQGLYQGSVLKFDNTNPPYQPVVAGENQTNIFNISTNTQQVNLEYNLRSTAFYSPVIYNDIYLQEWGAGAGGAPADTEYPLFYAFTEQPTDPATFSPSASYYFNSSVNRTNGTIGIEFNNVNYSMSNISNVFNKTLATLGAGSYNYYYWGYGNGTSHFYNTTSVMTYTVSINSSFTLNVVITPSNTVNYGTQTVATGSNCPDLSCNLYLDGNIKGNPNTVTLGVGTYNYSYSTLGTQNYSAKSFSDILTVNQATPSLTALLNGIYANLSVVYPQQVNASGTNNTGNLTIYQDGVGIAPGLNITLGGGYYQFDFNLTGNQNYTNVSTKLFANVTQATPSLFFLANGGTSNLSLIYPQHTNISATTSTGTVGLDKDTIDYLANNALNVTLGGGEYIFRANITGNQNYSNLGYVYYNITINTSTQSIVPLLNGNNDSITVTYPQQVNASFNGTNQTLVTIQLNTTTVTRGLNYSVGGVNWFVNFSAPANQNYSIFEQILNLIVNKADSNITLQLNHTRNNITINESNLVEINATLITGESTINLLQNGGLINTGNSPLYNDTNYTVVGTYNLSAEYPQTQNYTRSADNFFIFVIASTVSIPSTPGMPYFEQDLINLQKQVTSINDSVKGVNKSIEIVKQDKVDYTLWLIIFVMVTALAIIAFTNNRLHTLILYIRKKYETTA